MAIAYTILRDEIVCRRSVACALQCVPDIYISNNGSLRVLKAATTPDYFHADGIGSGAAMRVGPIGLIYPSDKLAELVRSVADVCLMTHADASAVAAACAVAAAISAAVEGRLAIEVLDTAIQAARLGRRWGRASSLPDVADQLCRAYESISNAPLDSLATIRTALEASCGIGRAAYCLVPTSVALAVKFRNARSAILAATNIGSDADTTAAIAGSIAGALAPDSVPAPWVSDRTTSQPESLRRASPASRAV
jgi:ADP-ribosylglycohydrolase